MIIDSNDYATNLCMPEMEMVNSCLEALGCTQVQVKEDYYRFLATALTPNGSPIGLISVDFRSWSLVKNINIRLLNAHGSPSFQKEICSRVEPDNIKQVIEALTGESIVPVLDLNTNEILKAFPLDMIGQTLYARFYDKKIVITVIPKQESILDREQRFMDELRTEKGLSKVSLFTGSGFLDHAIAAGLKNSGINSHCVFANELDDRYISNGLENNSALSGATTVQGSIANLHRFDIPQASMMVMGSPCVGFSKSGKSKNGIDSELLHEDAGHLFMYMMAVVLRVNPAIAIFENTPEAMNSVTFSLIEKMMVEQGYKIQKQVIDSRFFGSLEQRKRMAFVAVSEGLDVDTSLLKETGEPVIKVGDVMDAQIDESDWSPMTYLFDKQERDIAAGKGFRIHIVDVDSDRVLTIGKSYQKNRSTETKVRHPEVEGLYRLLTPSEHARIKGFNPNMVSGLPKTTAHEVLGNGVAANGFIALAELIGHQVGGVSEPVAPSSQSKLFEPETVEVDVPKSAPIDEFQLALFV